jgi:uncharacterized protein YbjT (DUF2867 family)
MMMKSTHDSPFLVTGAAGAIGAIGLNLTAMLLAKGHKVRALVGREDERAGALRRLGAEVVQGDLTDLSSMHRAIEGCARIYFRHVSLGGLSGGHGQYRRGGAPSRRRGFREHVSDDGDADEHHRDHRKPGAQAALAGGAGTLMVGSAGRQGAADGLPGRLLPFSAATARDADELALPMGAGKTSPVSSVDVARAVAAILDDPAPHIGHLNDLTGPKSADLDHYARVFSEALGRTIRYRHAPTSNWSEKLRAAGLSEHVVDHLTVMTELHKQGRYDRSSEDYLKPTGEKPTSMADFAEPHAAEFTRPSRFCAGPSGFDAEIEVQRAADRLHPDKGCGSLPARRYDLLPDRSRSAGPS